MASNEGTGPKIDDEMLMNYVQNYRCIYDKTCVDYRKPQAKRNAWKSIAKSMDLPDGSHDLIKNRYTSIRTVFSKYVKSLTIKSGSGRNELPNIKPEFEYLRWLIVHIKHRKGKSNLKSAKRRREIDDNESEHDPVQEHDEMDYGNQKESDSDEESDQDSREHTISLVSEPADLVEPEEQHSPELGGPSASTPEERSKKSTKSKKTKSASSTPQSQTKRSSWSKGKKSPSAVDMDKEFMKTMNSLQKAIAESDRDTSKSEGQGNEENDEDRHYCLSLVGQLKKLEPQYKSLAKMQIMKVLNDIEC